MKHRYAEKINESNKQNTVNEKEPATEKLVCYTAVFSVDTQRPRRRKKTYMEMTIAIKISVIDWCFSLRSNIILKYLHF